MASILDFLITTKASVLFSKVSEKTGETQEDVATVFGVALPLFLGGIQQKINSEEKGLKELIALLDDSKLGSEFITDLNKIELEQYISVGNDFLQKLIRSEEKLSKILSEVLVVKESSVSYILPIAAGTLVHLLSIQRSKINPDNSEMKELIRSHLGVSSKFNNSLISTILDKNEEGNIIQDVEGRIIGGGLNENNKNRGALKGMLGGK